MALLEWGKLSLVVHRSVVDASDTTRRQVLRIHVRCAVRCVVKAPWAPLYSLQSAAGNSGALKTTRPPRIPDDARELWKSDQERHLSGK
jgi:hypothetical protein